MSIYREYDIRGIVGTELNEESVSKIGYVLAERIDGDYVAVGYDARLHSPELFEYLVRGLNAGGKTVLNLGMVPTPLCYFAGYQDFEGMEPAASVMITGSHNPKEYNGLKITVDKLPFFGEDIYALGRQVEALASPIPPAERRVVDVDVVDRYIEFMAEHFRHLRGMKTRIVYDCGNGVAGVVLPKIYDRLGINASGIYIEPDGNFPNHHPDPTIEANLRDIKRKLREEKAKIAFAYDGDADRLAVLTPKRNIVGDQMCLLFTLGMEHPTVIGEVKCSQVMYDEIRRRGGKAIMYKTGHSNLKVKLKETGADLACEVSGHIFFADRYYGYDDAIYATFRMLELIHKGIDLDEEIERLPKTYATDEIKIKTTEEKKFRTIESLKESLQHPPAGSPISKS
jgi:phosphomannomutase/phosphoglucomutase